MITTREMLEIRAGITVYTMENGVEQRRPAFPTARSILAFMHLQDAAARAVANMNQFNRAFLDKWTKDDGSRAH